MGDFKMRVIALSLAILAGLTTTANACSTSVGDRVHVVLYKPHNQSSASVHSGYVRTVGSSSSKVEWDYCTSGGGCEKWIDNCNLHSTKAAAEAERKESDANHTSVGEAVGGAAAVGLGLLILCSMSGDC